jgi:MADS-box transcription factor
METPISALPSRFVENGLLPSPSSFYPEWGFGRGDSNMLPSPLTFQTPVVQNGPSFARDDSADRERKRKTSDDGSESGQKRIKA